jgi:hypothetical protein
MKEWDTQAYGSPSVDAEAGDRSLRGKGLRLKKLAQSELVKFVSGLGPHCWMAILF